MGRREQFDVTDLPPKAKQKLLDLRERRDEAMTLAREAQNRIGDLRLELERAEQHLKRLEKPHAEEVGVDLSHYRPEHEFEPGPPARYRYGVPHPTDPRVVDAKKSITTLSDQIERAQEKLHRHQLTWESLGGLVRNIENYLLGLDGVTAHKPEIDVKLKKNETVTDAIWTRRRRLRELKADAHRVRSAPIPSSSAKKLIAGYVQQLNDRGGPDLMATVEAGLLDRVTLPQLSLEQTLHGGDSHGAPIAVALNYSQPDVMAVLAWLMPDVLLRRLHAEIDELADDAHALTDEERAGKLQEIAGDRLAVEREEEHLVEQAEAQGITISRRPEADPRAVLVLSSSLPAPKGDDDLSP